MSQLDRRTFLRLAGAGAGAAALRTAFPATLRADAAPARPAGDRDSHVVVIGAGAWGGWTARWLRQQGARVTLVDAYGPGNSRAASGDESRGIRSSYGDRSTGEQWMRWAREAIARWEAFDAEFAPRFGGHFYVRTGDVIMRAKDEPFLERTREWWTKLGVAHEVIDGDEVRKRWPVINADDTTIALVEPDAGVARARATTQAVHTLAVDAGATPVIGRVRLNRIASGALDGVTLDNGDVLRGDAYVFACGPWLRTLFPDVFGERMRLPLGHVCYFATPPGDDRFTLPNLPSWNIPGVTGWPALPFDSRGFRVRGSIAAPMPDDAPPPAPPPAPDPELQARQQDPDRSDRFTDEERVAGSRRVLARRFPLLADAPLLEARSCHYQISNNRNFVVDRVPGTNNAWIAGAGQAEGFKFGPVIGEYIATRVLGGKTDPAIDAAFVLPGDTPASRDNFDNLEELL